MSVPSGITQSLAADPASLAQRSPAAVTIREARFSDYERILALQIRNGLGTRSYSDWAGLWTGNPAYINCGGALPIGWVVETEEGEIVGYMGNLPLEYSFNGGSLMAATVYSWAVDLPYRASSLALMAKFVKQPRVDLMVCNTVNAAAEKAYGAFRFDKAPAGAWNRCGFWITGYRGFARTALGQLSVPFANALSYPVAAALALRDRVPRLFRGHGHQCDFEICARFDRRFDRFWEELSAQNPGKLLASRSRDTLEWHFRYALARKKLWIWAASERERITAYALVDRQDRDEIGLKRVRIVDFQALHGYENALRPALDWVLDRCHDEGVHSVEHVGCWLDELGVPGVRAPYRRTLTSWMFYFKPCTKDLAGIVQDATVWAPTSFDGDASI